MVRCQEASEALRASHPLKAAETEGVLLFRQDGARGKIASLPRSDVWKGALGALVNILQILQDEKTRLSRQQIQDPHEATHAREA